MAKNSIRPDCVRHREWQCASQEIKIGTLEELNACNDFFSSWKRSIWKASGKIKVLCWDEFLDKLKSCKYFQLDMTWLQGLLLSLWGADDVTKSITLTMNQQRPKMEGKTFDCKHRCVLASFPYFKGEILLLSNFLPSLMYMTSFIAIE